MKDHAWDMLFLKIGASATAVGTVMSGFFVKGATLPFFDVSISTLGMSAAGSMIAFAYGTPVEDRKKLYGYAIGGTFAGVWAVKVLPTMLDWDWYVGAEMAAPTAGFFALISRWAIPFVIEQLPVIFRRMFNVGNTPPGDKP